MSHAMPVLFLHHSNDLYGADIMLLETVRGLDPSRYQPIVVLPEDCRGPGGLASELERLGVDFQFLSLAVIRRRYFKLTYLLAYCLEFLIAVWKVCRIIRCQKVAVVHSNTLAICPGAFAAKLMGIPHIWHVHEMLVCPHIIRKVLHFLATRLSDRVVCISEAVRQHVLEDQPGYTAKLIVIYNGLPLENYIAKGDGHEIRREFGVPEDAPLVGMVGRVNHWKGQIVLARAAKLLLARFPDAYFLSVGGVFADERHHMNALKSQVSELGIASRFLIKDFRRDVPEILAALDVYVHPSILPEPFGLVVLEAMAGGKVVVAASHGGPVEILEDKISGLLVQPGDPASLANGIAYCLEDRERNKAIGARAKERAFSKFHIRGYMANLQAVYDEMLNEHKKHTP